MGQIKKKAKKNNLWPKWTQKQQHSPNEFTQAFTFPSSNPFPLRKHKPLWKMKILPHNTSHFIFIFHRNQKTSNEHIHTLTFMLERRTGDSRNDVGLSPGGIVMHGDLEIGSFAGDISLYLAVEFCPDPLRFGSSDSPVVWSSELGRGSPELVAAASIVGRWRCGESKEK